MMNANDLYMDGRAKVASYRMFLEVLLETGLPSLTHKDAWKRQGAADTYCCVRHDVDHKLEVALQMARIEHELGVRATYFLLPPGDYGCDENYYGSIVGQYIRQNDRLREVAQEIAGLGHEIGLHNDFLQLSRKLRRVIPDVIAEQITYFRGAQIPISGSASHGSRFARTHQLSNYEIFTECLRTKSVPRDITFEEGDAFSLFSVRMQDLGLEYEAYSLKRDIYISDVGSRMIVCGEHFDTFVPTIFSDLLGSARKIIALIHPDWWKALDGQGSPKFIAAPVAGLAVPQNAVETAPAEMSIVDSPTPRFMRADGKPFRIAVRGDCCSRRAIVLNKQLFPRGVELIINEKSPSACFVDALRGVLSSRQRGLELSDVATMPATLKHYYVGQFERSVLDAENIDLLLIDTYADMNFELWRHRSEGWSLWIHPKFVRRREELTEQFESIGWMSLTESVEATCRIIDHVRLKNPDVPVVILNQPVEYYPKLDKRREYYRLGELVAAERNGVYFAAPLAKDDLDPADVGSCGPGLTLHFTGATYLKMLENAWQRGLRRHLVRRETGDPSAATSVVLAGRDVQPNAGTVARLAVKSPTTPAKGAEITSRVTVGGALELTSTTAAVVDIPRVTVSYRQDSPECVPACSASVDAAFRSFAQYFTHPEIAATNVVPRFTPMLIATGDVASFTAWEAHIRKSFSKGERLREKRKAISQGYYVKQYASRLFIPDICDINHSKPERSGGAMRGAYLRSVEEMGGAPKVRYEVKRPACPYHWGLTFGTFISDPGHMQGSVQVDERLVAYISLRRIGDLVIYSQILGHGDHLKQGVLVLLHHEVIQWVSEQRDDLTRGLRFIMYGGAQNGGEFLFNWKRRSGFTPHMVSAFRGLADTEAGGSRATAGLLVSE
ncbi:hypothetical protein EV699_11588 [Plasticicumulans lactativorans]|uniref:Uncharacterized protein n=1 Tax=Plasticicumulans lactativorans TaxID=1133106 RepID=A0A4V2SCQ7_9GAMM|nr:hypothetical protein [Plasticicumulans lactativorans]TCO80310.1 hypothetical protein EV699_11588 [Plasticicumulans lactativorans]